MFSFQACLLVALGGALGAVARYAAYIGIHRSLGFEFPYATLCVNVVGSFVIGLLFVALIENRPLPTPWRELLMIGVLGSFTTFSTFSLDTVNLLTAGAYLRASLNVFANVGLCLGFCWAGLVLARNF